MNKNISKGKTKYKPENGRCRRIIDNKNSANMLDDLKSYHGKIDQEECEQQCTDSEECISYSWTPGSKFCYRFKTDPMGDLRGWDSVNCYIKRNVEI